MSFDLLAPHYRWMESIAAGTKLQCCRTACLESVPRAEKVLIYGDGNGRFLAELLKHFPAAQVTSVDFSARMIALARKRLRREGLPLAQVEFVHANVLDWIPPERTYDLVVTHFFLDCFRPDQLAVLMPRIANAAQARAHWLVADFKVADGNCLKRWRSQVILALMYVFFRAVTRLSARRITPPDSFLASAGFALQHRVESDWGLLHSDCWMR